ncbi:MAG TPA: 50S ribosomal protein L10 [Lentisphaeria bacterium]|nr:MAG: 50S ribosomal protein L10 [Lentisphaerae bacterium GWF2_49_21]HBC87942.1 50S ribosomal protein L10 [Lentisphaeria bacterium]
MRVEKVQLLNEIGNTLEKSDYIFLITYKGLKVSDFSELRGSLGKFNAECHVLKNRMIRKAAEKKGIKGLSELKLTGDTALVSGKGDAGPVAKALMVYSKAHEQVSPKAGYLEGAMVSKGDITAIASLPSRDALRSQLLGVLLAPSRNLVTILNVKASEIVNVLNAYKDKKEKSN